MSALEGLGISREDIVDKAAEKLLESTEGDGPSLADSLRYKVIKDMAEQAKPKIESILNDAIRDLVDAPFTPIDEWGEPVRKKSSTLRELVKEKALRFLSQPVDRDGKDCSYQSVGSRGEWLAKKAASEAITFEVKKELTKAVESAKTEIRELVAKHITEILLRK